MKKIYTYLFAFASLGLVACSDSFLDSEPLAMSTTDNFYKTKADAEKAIIGCYDGLQCVWSSGVSFPVLSEVASDNCFGGTGNGDGWGYQAIDEFDITRSKADKDLLNENWKAYYLAIFRCNMLLSKMDQIAWAGDNDSRNNIEGQARFLRAYLYFDMMRLWGNIPLLTEPSSDNIPQSPAEDVYKVIAEDLKWAATNMKSEAYSAAWAKEKDGYVTKWAAKALLARVYLFYTGYYGKTDLVGVATQAEVLAGLEDVIANGNYALLPDFANLWPAASAYERNKDAATTIAYAGKGNSETVFAIKYNNTSNYDGKTDGNQWLVMLGLRNVKSFPYSNGWGACTVDTKLWNAYNAKDTRRTASIIALKEENITPDIVDQREYTGYITKKYSPISVRDKEGNLVDEAVSLGGLNFQIGQYQDYISIRFADVLLMASELGSTKAQDYFNLVRQRALKSDFTALTVTKDNILKERQLELAFEGHRYWDVLRQGVTKASTTLATSTTVLSGGNSTTKQIKAENFIKTKGLQQIPDDQINKSKGLIKQNEGW